MPQTRFPQAPGGPNGLVRGGALDDPVEHHVVTGFGAVVDDTQAQFTQLDEFLDALAQDAPCIAVDADPPHRRDFLSEKGQDARQMVGGKDEGVAVTEKNTADGQARISHRSGFVDVGGHGLEWLDFELLFGEIVHRAVGAAVVTAPYGNLQEQAFSLAGRAKNAADVVHRNPFQGGQELGFQQIRT